MYFPMKQPCLLSLLIIPALLLCSSGKAHGQLVLGLNTDSLKRILYAMPADTHKVQMLIRIGQQYESNLPDTAVFFYEQARLLSRQLKYPMGELLYISNYTAVLNVQGRFEESLQLNLQAVDLAERHGLKPRLIKALLNTGAVYQYKEDYLKAADYYLEALPLLEATGETQSLSLVYNNLCGLYRDLNQPQKALQYGRKALEYAQKNDDPVALAAACMGLGNALQSHGSLDEAAAYLNRAYAIGKQINDINTQETALINLGNVYTDMKRPGKYIASFSAALPLAESLGDVGGKAFALQGIGVGLFLQKQYKQAEGHLHAAIGFAKEHGQKKVLKDLLLLMSDVQIGLGRLDLSQQYREQYDSASNAFLNEPLLKNLQELETKYDVEKKRREILQKNLLLQEKDRAAFRQRIWTIVFAAGALFLTLLLLLGYRFYRQRQQLNKKAVQALQAEQDNVRLKSTLEGQLQERRRISREMHDDMGAGLTSVLFLGRAIQQPAEVAEKIRHTAEGLVRKMNEIIWAMSGEQDNLDSLIGYIRSNTVEALDNAGIRYDFHAEGSFPDIHVSQSFRRNIYLVVKEAVHNVIRHAQATDVSIAVHITDGLNIIIRDNGRGIDQSAINRFGNGLKNMRERMQDVNGSLHIAVENGTVIDLRAPLI
jgi:two-component system, NarL family, sensor kinase